MTQPNLDEIAADDALIEAIRSGATADDIASDPAASVLIALRDEATAPTAEPAPVAAIRRSGPGWASTRRLVAGAIAGTTVVLAGVGTAVAGDPAAAFKYVLHQGVDLGSRFGSPANDNGAQNPLGPAPINGEDGSADRDIYATPSSEHPAPGFHRVDWNKTSSPFPVEDKSLEDMGVPPLEGERDFGPERAEPSQLPGLDQDTWNTPPPQRDSTPYESYRAEPGEYPPENKRWSRDEPQPRDDADATPRSETAPKSDEPHRNERPTNPPEESGPTEESPPEESAPTPEPSLEPTEDPLPSVDPTLPTEDPLPSVDPTLPTEEPSTDPTTPPEESSPTEESPSEESSPTEPTQEPTEQSSQQPTQ